ncbi:MAG: LysR substrate-binding domain-containing protein [Noviherbaspirillum sp.]
MDLLHSMAVFARVVEARSFTEAAKRLESTTSAVSKQIARLEADLGTRLLNRTTRRLSLTEAGQTFYEYYARILREAEEAQHAIGQLRASPRGRLRVAAPPAFARLHLMPGLAGFLRAHPQVEVDMLLTERSADLAEEGLDLAVRIVEEPGEHMAARPLAPIRWAVCATPAYLARHGEPATAQELVSHNCLAYAVAGSESLWTFDGDRGETKVRVHGDLRVNNNEALREVVLDDHGIALLPTYVAWQDLQTGRLRRVLENLSPRGGFGRHIHFVYLPNRFVPPKVRAFIDYYVARCGTPPYWDGGL